MIILNSSVKQTKDLITFLSLLPWCMFTVYAGSSQLVGRMRGVGGVVMPFSPGLTWQHLEISQGEGNGTPLQYSCLEIPWMEELGRLQSMGSLRVGRDQATSLSLFTFAHRRRKWQPTPVFLPGESQGPESLVGWHLWGGTESDTTEVTQQQQRYFNCYDLVVGRRMRGSYYWHVLGRGQG